MQLSEPVETGDNYEVDSQNEARISFKEYQFFIPTDGAGKEVTLVDRFRVKKISEKQAKHYAEDAGDTAENVNGLQVEYSICKNH